MGWICDPEFPQTPEEKSHCLVRWYIRRLKYQKHFPIGQKRPKQEYHWNWMHTYFSSLSAFIQVTIHRRVSNKFLLLWVPFQIFFIFIWVYIFMFVTSRQSHCMRDLLILKILSVMLLLKDTCLPWLDKLMFVNGLYIVVWCVNRY